MKINAIRHPSGKRVFVGIPQQGQSPKAGFIKSIASKTGVAETSAREILTQGKTRKGWHLEEMQRERLPMIITYKLTPAGQQYAQRSESAFGEFLRRAEMGEASDISAAMLAAGFDKHDRNRVTIDAARAREKGLLEIIRKANKIN